MINELFPFQTQAVNDLRSRIAMAMDNYRKYHVPQVISLQAPTGSGKTVIMASLIEDIYYGSENYAEQTDAIFVWLSDSPALNEQSRQKIDQKADKIRFDQCITISDESFDQEMLDDGHIYFLNTQKLGKTGNLSRRSDARQYTIWETLENTKRYKSDRLYFIIDEAHRGMTGRAAGTATTIMQRFIKGFEPYRFSPMPVVIGMSATADRFNTLVGDTTSSLQKVVVHPASVRESGLLKDRIILSYPEDPTKFSDMAVLQAATDEWQYKCRHWHAYTVMQGREDIHPVFVIQVCAGSGDKISDTDLDDLLAKIEQRTGKTFAEHEVVHTFGSTGTLTIHGLRVHHVEPEEIAENRRIRLVLFKENLSTGWDCPRAETMMSFRRAEDATYIAQLLGRMIRTPLQSRILLDDSLNDVRLYLPYFNRDTVQSVVDELQSAEGGDIPTSIDGESLEEQVYVSWSVQAPITRHKSKPVSANQRSLPFSEVAFRVRGEVSPHASIGCRDVQTARLYNQYAAPPSASPARDAGTLSKGEGIGFADAHPDSTQSQVSSNEGDLEGARTDLRQTIIHFINTQGFLTYVVRTSRINSYLKSLLQLAGLLTQTGIYTKANEEIITDITNFIREYADGLRLQKKYDELARQVMEFRLSVQIFDAFGETIKSGYTNDLITMSESDLDRQLRVADAKLGNYGFSSHYGRRFYRNDNPNQYKIDCILYVAEEECIKRLNQYAETKFHQYNDRFRKYIVSKSEDCKKQYSDIIKNGDAVSEHNFSLPETVNIKIEKEGKIYDNHLYADNDGLATIKLNTWEEAVIEEESRQIDFVCWLRNPPKQPWALCIPYEMQGETKATYPDFIIIRRDAQLGYIIDILEPHNPDFKDNLAKAKGFAKYAEKEQRIGRIELIRQTKDASGQKRFMRLDMARGIVRQKVLAAINNDELDHIFDMDGTTLDK